ncbi:MAG: single-stranded-DNA-specific exonuclease RecJ [Patescibacteria group bacterium]|nr:single-stranded-DNA-specific exonuclease RecJ [Patescibacteria group bacterium]MDD4610768.1 single-stranded-DNA-specific exonuclease RecJ [Patescibacteria group bacterium]
MKKIWQLAPKIDKRLSDKFPEFSPVILQLLFNRGFTGREEIDKFFYPDLEKDIFDPFFLRQMNEAVDLIIKHVKAQNKIVIYGDYDADGVTSSVVLTETLKIFKAQVDYYIPDRIKEGYSLNMEAIKKIIEAGAKLIITVDCGIISKNEVKYAQELGAEVVITDHHTPPEKDDDLPPSIIINPHVRGENYPFKYLAGVGVAFKLAQALIAKSTLSEVDKKKLETKLLDLVAIGTIADLVSLVGENRVLVKKGLEVISNNDRLGLNELIKISQLNNGKKLDSWNIGFQIAPRLNAAGRMDLAHKAFDLLITKDKSEAENLAQFLNEKNAERQRLTEEISVQAEAEISDKDNKIIISVCPENTLNWNEGVIGLAAGRLCEKFYRPTLVIARTEDGYKGSGRSIAEFDLVAAIRECGEFLERYGGHPRSCGFSLKAENLEKFAEKMRIIAEEKLHEEDLQPKLIIDCEADIKEIDEDLVNQIEKFSPFGQDNFKPKLMSRNIQIKDIMTMGAEGQHIKFRFNGFWAISFGGAEGWKDYKVGDIVDVVYNLEINEFNGRREVQMKIVDMRKI